MKPFTASACLTCRLFIKVTLSLSVDQCFNQASMFCHSPFFLGISDADERCSCYSFKKSSPKSWLEARNSCRLDNKHLVAIETEREWKFINHKIQTRKNGKDDEWYIGLHKNKTTGNWIWVNGKALTIFKWQDNEPQDNDSYALMAKEFPPGHEGTFSGFLGNIRRGWICEEETGINMAPIGLYPPLQASKPRLNAPPPPPPL